MQFFSPANSDKPLLLLKTVPQLCPDAKIPDLNLKLSWFLGFANGSGLNCQLINGRMVYSTAWKFVRAHGLPIYRPIMGPSTMP